MKSIKLIFVFLFISVCSFGQTFKYLQLQNAGAADTTYVNGRAWYNPAYNHWTFIENGAAKHFTIGGGISGLTIGTTSITSGGNTKVLYNNAGFLGEYNVSGSGNVAMTSNSVIGLVNATGLPLSTGVTGLLPDGNISSASTWNAKQSALVSGTNIKTVNSNSLLGSGNVAVGDALIANTIAQFAAPAADFSMNSHKITNLTDPTSAQDAVTKAYADGIASGLSVKNSTNEGTISALPSNTYSNGASGVGATLTGVATGVLTVDGVTVALNDRVLVKNEVTQSHNGIYLCTTAGAVGVAYILTRATDFDQAAEIAGGFTFVVAGTVNANIGFVVSSSGPYTMGTTAITFTQFSGAGSYSAGTGMLLSGTVFTPDFGSTSGKVIQGGGALGTPISGTATNLTGLPMANVIASDYVSLTYGSTVNFDCGNKDKPLGSVSASGSFTVNMTNVSSGATGIILMTSSVSSLTLTFDTDFTNRIDNATITSYTYLNATGKDYFIQFTVHGTIIEWNLGDPVVYSNIQKFALQRRAAVQSTANATLTTIVFDTNVADNAGIFSSGAPTRLTVPGTGNKLVTISISGAFDVNTTGLRRFWIYKNGSIDPYFPIFKTTGISTVGAILQGSVQNYCSGGDYFEFVAYQSSGGSLNVTGLTASIKVEDQ